MKPSQLAEYLPESLYNQISSLESLRPCQEKAIRAGLLEKKSLLVCSPTGSGKTLVAEIACIKSILEKKGKAVYIVPLKSLASEKYKEFSETYKNVKVAISIGDLDSSDAWLQDYDLIITTAEKLDSLIRHGAHWLSQIEVAVIDEIHLLNDAGRGPTLEILITLLKKLLPKIQLISLSATIGNPKELATWLSSELVEDSWRPVKLYQGVFQEQHIDFFTEKENTRVSEEKDEDAINIALNTISMGKQALVFCPSKASAESSAEKISKNLRLKDRALGKKIISAISSPTKQCKKLAGCVERGVAFHHAGLTHKQKQIVEDNFKIGAVKVICCTPTLAAGINLPAFRAIMKSLRRYSEKWGSVYIPVLEYLQMVGRAGRPGMEDFGEAITIARSKAEKEEIYEKYICGVPEEILSKLAVEPVLRAAILSLIASGFSRTQGSLLDFFESTFYGFQYNDVSFNDKILSILMKLKEQEFIEFKQGKLSATQLGKRISELYIDPESAYAIIKSLKLGKPLTSIGLLHLICSTTEMNPIRYRNRDFEFVNSALTNYGPNLLAGIPNEWDIDYDNFMSEFKTSLILQNWIDEETEEFILEQYKVRPGELHVKVANTDWLLYSSQEIARILGLKESISPIIKLRIRIKHGIRNELLPLIKLKGVSRVRARKLFNKGVTDMGKLRQFDINELVKLFGRNIAAKLKEQVGIQVDASTLKKHLQGQITLDGF